MESALQTSREIRKWQSSPHVTPRRSIGGVTDHVIASVGSEWLVMTDYVGSAPKRCRCVSHRHCYAIHAHRVQSLKETSSGQNRMGSQLVRASWNSRCSSSTTIVVARERSVDWRKVAVLSVGSDVFDGRTVRCAWRYLWGNDSDLAC